MGNLWDPFLTEQDRKHLARSPRKRVGFGTSPAVLMVDNYRWALGDKREPLLDAIERWPGSTGLAGWKALDSIKVLLQASRSAAIPIVHVTGLPYEESGIAAWGPRARDAAASRAPREHQERRYEIVEQAAPIPGEAVLRKSAPSAFFGTPLASHLSALRIDTLIVGGESTSGCVRASVVDAASYSLRVIIPQECVYDRHESAHAINLFDMDRKYADVMTLVEVLAWIDRHRTTGTTR